MKHFGLIVAALLSSSFGIYLLVTTKPATTLTTILAAAFVAFALFCCARLEMSAFVEMCSSGYRNFRGQNSTPPGGAP